MAIDFNKLPTNNPASAPEGGLYKATITKAEMRQPKDLTKPQYLSLTYNLFDKDGKKAGVMYDGLYDTDKPLLLYKLGRFVNALGLELTGSLELKALTKVVVNRSLIVDTELPKDSRFLSTKVFDTEIYWPVSMMSKLMGEAVPNADMTDEEAAHAVFDAPDGEEDDGNY